MEAIQTEDLDQQIARLEAELAQLKAQRTRQGDRKPKPLDGIRILDMSRFIFGPFCAQMLADMGADGIKLEPLQGDPARASGNVRVAGDISPPFLARNRNKRSLAMDMSQAEAQEIALKLALQSDVLLHNFRPGIMGRMGLDAKRLLEDHPIIGSIKVVGIPVKLSATPGAVGAPPPQLGQHTHEILRELG